MYAILFNKTRIDVYKRIYTSRCFLFYNYVFFFSIHFSAVADGILSDNPHLVLLFYLAQLFLRELFKSYRLIQVVPMDMSGYYGKTLLYLLLLPPAYFNIFQFHFFFLVFVLFSFVFFFLFDYFVCFFGWLYINEII